MDTIFDTILDPDNTDNIVLADPETGEQQEFEQIAVIPLDDEIYVMLHPVDEEDSAYILRLDQEEDALVYEENEDVLHRVYDIYLKLLEDAADE